VIPLINKQQGQGSEMEVLFYAGIIHRGKRHYFIETTFDFIETTFVGAFLQNCL